MAKQGRLPLNPFDKARDAATLVLVFQMKVGYKQGQRLLRLIWMGSRTQMHAELLKMLTSGELTRGGTFYGIDYGEMTRFEVTVKKDKKGFHLTTMYVTKPKEEVERELRELATLPPIEDQSGSQRL